MVSSVVAGIPMVCSFDRRLALTGTCVYTINTRQIHPREVQSKAKSSLQQYVVTST